jgi:hypothetical protein
MAIGMKIASKFASDLRLKIETMVEDSGAITTTSLTRKTLMIQIAITLSPFKIITIKGEITRITDSNISRCLATSTIRLLPRCRISENS